VRECNHLGEAVLMSVGGGLRFKGQKMAGVGISSAFEQLTRPSSVWQGLAIVCAYLAIK
jgi:hypothetical protein